MIWGVGGLGFRSGGFFEEDLIVSGILLISE